LVVVHRFLSSEISRKQTEMEELKGGIYITPKDIQILKGCAINAARREHLTIRDALGKSKNYLTIFEYCTYCEVEPTDIIRYLNQFR
jgi:hypothetical protein